MAEETPGNLGSIFGGWAAGRAAGNKRIDQSVDRLESQINKLTDAIETLTNTMGGGRTSNGGVPGGGTQTGSTPNGGNGSHVGPSAGLLANLAAVFSSSGTGRRANGVPLDPGYNPPGPGGPGGGGPPPPGGPGGGGRGPNGGGWVSQHGATFAKGATAFGVTALGVYTKNHSGSQVTGQTLASMYAGGPDWNRAYQSGMTNDYVSHGTADHWAMISAMGQGSGYLAGTRGWNQNVARVQGISATNPMISTTQGMSASMALAAPQTFNRMQGMGINPLGSNGLGDPRSVARQLLAKMHTQNVKTPNEVAALFGPAGNATVTLNSFVSNGFLPAEAYQPVRSEMWNILMAQVHGMSFNSYARNESAANTSDTARDRLRNAGIAADTTVQAQHRREGMTRQTEATTIGGFTTALLASTTAINQMRAVVNKILGVGPVGEVVGLASGGAAGGLGGLLSKIPGFSMLGKVAMASGGVLPGYSPGRDTHHFYSPTGGHLDLSGGEGILIPQATRAVGGPSGIKAINDAARRQSFADGGVFKNPDQKVTMDGKYISAIAAAQIRLAEQIGHLNLTIMQGGFGGSHIAASGPSHNYPGVADISPGTIGVEKLLRQVGFAAWARNIRGRSSVGSGAHVHAVSLLDPGDRSSAQVYGSWAHHGNGLSGYNNDPAPHYAWIPNLRKRLGAMNLKGLGGGGGGGGGGGTGGGLGAGGGTTVGVGTGVDGGGGGFMGGGGGGGLFGDYSEVSALALGGGGGGPGPTGAPSLPNGGSGGGGGGLGGLGPYQGTGAPGVVRAGSFNELITTSAVATNRDLAKIMGHVDVLSLEEIDARKARGQAGFLSQRGWGLYRPNGNFSDTAIAWDESKYQLLRKGVRKLNNDPGGPIWNRERDAAYALLRDKATGAEFWEISAHPVAHGYKQSTPFDPARQGLLKKQTQAIVNLYHDLAKTGRPVILGGDLNQWYPNLLGLTGLSDPFKGHIDHLMADPTMAKLLNHGTVSTRGLASDHPFIWADYKIGSAGGGSGGSGGHGASGVYAALRGAGFSKVVAAGIMGNMQYESGFDPNIIQGGGHSSRPTTSAGYGLVQWTPGTKLRGYIGGSVATISNEVAALHAQLMGHGPSPEGAAGHALGGARTPEEAARIFGLKYERYAGGVQSGRESAARHWYNSYAIGAWNLNADHDARVHKGEMIIPSKIADIVRQELEAPGIGANLGRRKSVSGGGGMDVVFQNGAIQINFSGSEVTKPIARQTARWVVDAIMEDDRMKALAEG